MGAKKGTIPKSVEYRKRWRICALFLFAVMLKGNDVGKNGIYTAGPHKGKRASKRDLCIYMAQHMKEFRRMWLECHPGKKYPPRDQFPLSNKGPRAKLGISYYNSLIKDRRRFKDVAFYQKIFKGSGIKITVWGHNIGDPKKVIKL